MNLLELAAMIENRQVAHHKEGGFIEVPFTPDGHGHAVPLTLPSWPHPSRPSKKRPSQVSR